MRLGIFAVIAFIAAVAVVLSQSEKDWSKDPQWLKTRYGGWGGPGVSPGRGPMDDVKLKDYAPKSSLVIEETTVLKAKIPAIARKQIGTFFIF